MMSVLFAKDHAFIRAILVGDGTWAEVNRRKFKKLIP